jgi:hypothetical protein
MAKRKKNNNSNNDLENIHIQLITKLLTARCAQFPLGEGLFKNL